MAQILDLTNSSNWEQIYSQSYSAEIIAPNKYKMIPEISFPQIMERNIIAVSANSSVAPPSWRFAGIVDQKIRSGLVVGGAYDGNLSQRKIWLNRNTIIIFPQLTFDYALTIKIPYWIEQITLTFWQYVGIQGDSVEVALSDLENVAIEIRDKVNTL